MSSQNSSDGENISYLRYYMAHLVRIWTALSMIRRPGQGELIGVFRDLCSDKLRNMLHEFTQKRSWTLGFEPNGTEKHRRVYKRLLQANKWFEGYKNHLHYRNASGAHMQPLSKLDHMFQYFGYGDEREWMHLTKGVAACLIMMKGLDRKKSSKFWREIRDQVRGKTKDGKSITIDGKEVFVTMPIGVKALFQGYIVDVVDQP